MSAALQIQPWEIREPTKREATRFIRRAWLRSFGPLRNDRGAYSQRWLLLGRHKLDPGLWSRCYAALVDALLGQAVTVVLSEGGRAIAWACYEPGDRGCVLHFLYVDPTHRGRGAGRYLHDSIARGRPVTYTHQTRREDG